MTTATLVSRPILAEDGLELVGLVPPGVLAALAVVAFLAVLLAVLIGWRVLRRVRRSPLASRGRALAENGLFTVGSMALPPGRREFAALGARVNGIRNELACQLEEATATGRYLGDAGALLPRLIGEGETLVARLRRLSLSTRTGPAADAIADVTAEAEDYTARAETLLDSFRSTAHRTTDPVTASEIGDAIVGLRARDEAYQEFMRPSAPRTPVDPLGGQTAMPHRSDDR